MSATFDPTALTPLDHQLAAAWRQTAAELSIAVTAPFELPVRDGVFRYGALVHGFGTAKGVLLRVDPPEFHPDQCGAIWTRALEAGFTCMNVAPLFAAYSVAEAIYILNFFLWCGPDAQRPPWHVGPVAPGTPKSEPGSKG